MYLSCAVAVDIPEGQSVRVSIILLHFYVILLLLHAQNLLEQFPLLVDTVRGMAMCQDRVSFLC